MDQEPKRELDYCDLDPGKVCDNCCRCLDMDKPYSEIEVDFSRIDHIDEGNGSLDLFFDEQDEPYDQEGEGCDSCRVDPNWENIASRG